MPPQLELPRLIADGRPTKLGWALLGVGATVLIGIATLATAVLRVAVPLPDSAPGGQATEVLDADGELIGTLKGEQKRQIVPLEAIAEPLHRAVIATEDRNFYNHSGISLRGMVRALFTNVRAGSIEQGGSTITQQYARNAFGRVGTEQTIYRKLKEIALARRIENRYPKDTILGFYLNTIYFGRGAYGAEAAALTYFKKPASELSLDEAAYLAGIIRAPERFQPDTDPEAAVRIRNEVLGDMTAAGAITEAEADAARSVDLLAKIELGPTLLDSARAGYFMEYVRRLLGSERFGLAEAELLGGGLTIETSLDLDMQDAAEAAIASTLDRPDDPEAALIAMDPEGYVRAMVGGRDVADRVRALGFNYAAGQQEGGRPAGSVFKAIALASYLEEGRSLSDRYRGPGRITIDAPRCRDGEGNPWVVSNFGGQGFGRLDVTSATAQSVNTVYAQIMAEVVAPEEFAAVARRLGMTIPAREEVCALTLGTVPVTPLEVARAFTTFAARGLRPEPIVVTRVTGPDGSELVLQEPQRFRALPEDVADRVNEVLQRAVTRGTARSADIGRPAAAKTGTTQNNLDAWLAGYTPDLTAIVWMGYAPDESGRIRPMDDVRGRQVTGGSFPAVIWRKFMREALRETEPTSFGDPRPAAPGPAPARPAPVDPAPAPCPSGYVPAPDGTCAPAATASPSPRATPSFPATPTPSPTPAPTSPAPSPAPSPSPSPSPVPSPPDPDPPADD